MACEAAYKLTDAEKRWYHNSNQPRRVANRGPTDRVHLVIDCVVSDWLRGLIQEAKEAAGVHVPEALTVQASRAK